MLIHSSKFLVSSSGRGENNALTLYSPSSLLLVRSFTAFSLDTCMSDKNRPPINHFASLKSRTFEREKKVVICFRGKSSMKQVELNEPFYKIFNLFVLFNYSLSY